MTLTLADLERALAQIASGLGRANVDATLIGGVAVGKQSTPSDADDVDLYVDLNAAVDEGMLIRAVRSTQDIDLAVGAAEVPAAKDALVSLGGSVANVPFPLRIHIAGVSLDILSIPESVNTETQVSLVGASIGLVLLDEHRTLITLDGGERIHVATPAALVVLKALAWGDRFKARDLVDVALLALDDVVSRGGATGAELRSVGSTLPPFGRDALRALASQFETPDKRGPIEFANHCRGALSYNPDHWDDLEDRIRQVVHVTVRRMLTP